MIGRELWKLHVLLPHPGRPFFPFFFFFFFPGSRPSDFLQRVEHSAFSSTEPTTSPAVTGGSEQPGPPPAARLHAPIPLPAFFRMSIPSVAPTSLFE